ncbi:hypothetical protein ABZ747_09545 [Kitasatospora cineracea]|uniref:hypothetical protein n=1 Tax=Kitasatospora cineracea TaxID=88074 RepID=UPI0033F5DD81
MPQLDGWFRFALLSALLATNPSPANGSIRSRPGRLSSGPTTALSAAILNRAGSKSTTGGTGPRSYGCREATTRRLRRQCCGSDLGSSRAGSAKSARSTTVLTTQGCTARPVAQHPLRPVEHGRDLAGALLDLLLELLLHQSGFGPLPDRAFLLPLPLPGLAFARFPPLGGVGPDPGGFLGLRGVLSGVAERIRAAPAWKSCMPEFEWGRPPPAPPPDADGAAADGRGCREAVRAQPLPFRPRRDCRGDSGVGAACVLVIDVPGGAVC